MITIDRKPHPGDSLSFCGDRFEFTKGETAPGVVAVDPGSNNSQACVNLYFALRKHGYDVRDLGCQKNTFQIVLRPQEAWDLELETVSVVPTPDLAKKHLRARRKRR